MASIVTVLYDHRRDVRYACEDLSSLASSARHLGMDRIADHLDLIAGELNASAEGVLAAFSIYQSEQLSDSQKAVGETLSALLDYAKA